MKSNKIKVLLSEASSLSARQIITALGRTNYEIDVCTEDLQSIGIFSRYIKHIYVIPSVSSDPKVYMNSILHIIKKYYYDVLLPTHEQAFLFSSKQKLIEKYTHIAIAPFESFLQVQSKTASASLFQRLSLPQPSFTVLKLPTQSFEWSKSFPVYVKFAYSTAGQGVFFVPNAKKLSTLLKKLTWKEPNEILIQSQAQGKILCQVQALFSRGTLVALHSTQQYSQGIGNSQSGRLSVFHPIVKSHMEKLGKSLDWNGPMAVDYLYHPEFGPEYIEVNPRLVEPMNAVYSGINFAELMVKLSIEGILEPQKSSHINTISIGTLAMLLGDADKYHSRKHLVQIIFMSLLRVGKFKNSYEELTPIYDPPSLIPLSIILIQLLLKPTAAKDISSKSIEQYSLNSSAIKIILNDFILKM